MDASMVQECGKALEEILTLANGKMGKLMGLGSTHGLTETNTKVSLVLV